MYLRKYINVMYRYRKYLYVRDFRALTMIEQKKGEKSSRAEEITSFFIFSFGCKSKGFFYNIYVSKNLCSTNEVKEGKSNMHYTFVCTPALGRPF